MDTVPKSLDTIFQGNESLSIIEIFEEALEKSLENLNISDTGKQNIITPQTFQNNRLNALEIYPLNLLLLVMTEETITELVHVAYDEEFDQIKVSFQSSLFCGIIEIIIPFIGSCHQHKPLLFCSPVILFQYVVEGILMFTVGCFGMCFNLISFVVYLRQKCHKTFHRFISIVIQ